MGAETYVAKGFEPVAEEFQRNFAERGEVGAAFAVTHGGEPVVDLWGGTADDAAGKPWTADTLQVIFSGTKALVALCLLMLVDRGQLELDAPVCRYWPEFAANGKEETRIVELTSHRARLPGLRMTITENDILDDRRMASLLADQPQEVDPRARDVYHAITYGWLCGEVVRRVDGRSVGRFFADEVARPLGLELWIGLPPEFEERVAKLQYSATWGQRRKLYGPAGSGDELVHRVYNNPTLFTAGRMPWNRAEWHGAEIPAAGGIGTARSLARLYGCLAMGGVIDDVRLLSAATLAKGREEVTRCWDPLAEEPHAFGVGFQLQTEWKVLGPPEDAFGHGGAGGSVHCAWPSHGIGLSYAMNLMRDDQLVDERALALVTRVYRCLPANGPES